MRLFGLFINRIELTGSSHSHCCSARVKTRQARHGNATR